MSRWTQGARFGEELRSSAGSRVVDGEVAVADASYAPVSVPKVDAFAGQAGLPEISADRLTGTVLASALHFHGALLVQGLLSPGAVSALTSLLPAATGDPGRDQAPVTASYLDTVSQTLRASGVVDVTSEYLGSSPVGVLTSTEVNRSLNRVGLPWHQDASFFGGVYGAVNCWVALSPVGEDCPGLEVVTRRFDGPIAPDHQLYDGGSSVINEAVAALGPSGYAGSVMAAGDAVLFDEVTVHRTARQKWSGTHREIAFTWMFHPGRFPPSRIPWIV